MGEPKYDAEHVVLVDEDEEDPGRYVAKVFHPETCSFWIEVNGDNTRVEYKCGIAYETDAMGYEWAGDEPGWFWARHYTREGTYAGGWVEIETGVEMERLASTGG